MKWLVAYLTGIATSVISGVFLGFFFNGLNKEMAYISLTIGLLVAILVIRNAKFSSGLEKKDFSFWSVFTICAFSLFSLRAFLWLIFRVKDSIKVLSPNNLGDISLHINFIQYLANGISFWPDNQIYAGEKIHYPIGMDLFNSLLVLAGADLFQSLIWIGLLSSLGTMLALLIWGRSFTLAGFLFSGGFIGFQFFHFFTFQDYQTELAWKSIPLSMFVTQRGLLYALPAGLLLLSSWRERYFNSKKKSDSTRACCSTPLPFWIEILLYSSMPIFHIHTFIFFSFLLGIWVLFIPKDKKLSLLKFVLLSIPLATFFMLLLIDFSKTSSMIYLKWGWMQEKENFFRFWLLNFGMFLPLVTLLLLEIPYIPGVSKKESNNLSEQFKQNRMFTIPAVFLFVLFCNVMMAPWAWDNCKLLIWAYLILLPYLWENLISTWNIFCKYWICFILFFSGFVCICGGFNSAAGHEIFRYSEVTEVNQAIKNLPIENRFAAFPAYNHPLIFCGRKVVLGYPGWIWSHGYKLEPHNKKLKKLMLGEDGWQNAAKELGVRYIYWGYRENEEYKNSKRPWELTAKKIASGNWGEIFDLTQQTSN